MDTRSREHGIKLIVLTIILGISLCILWILLSSKIGIISDSLISLLGREVLEAFMVLCVLYGGGLIVGFLWMHSSTIWSFITRPYHLSPRGFQRIRPQAQFERHFRHSRSHLRAQSTYRRRSGSDPLRRRSRIADSSPPLRLRRTPVESQMIGTQSPTAQIVATTPLAIKQDLRRPRCIICRKWITSTDTVVYCPYCGTAAHYRHMKEWIKQKGICPVCKRPLKSD